MVQSVPAATLSYVPFTEDQANGKACGVKANYSTEEEWRGKKVVLFGVPGAFTPTCQVSHLPAFVKNYEAFKAKGVDIVAVIATNDAFVTSAWVNLGAQGGGKVLALSDVDGEWLSKAGLATDALPGMGPSLRSKRFAAIIENNEFKYLEVETGRGVVTVSGAEAVLQHL